ncbi:hypothetical protein UT300009_26690 [Paraclostridium bifermentans]
MYFVFSVPYLYCIGIYTPKKMDITKNDINIEFMLKKFISIGVIKAANMYSTYVMINMDPMNKYLDLTISEREYGIIVSSMHPLFFSSSLDTDPYNINSKNSIVIMKLIKLLSNPLV